MPVAAPDPPPGSVVLGSGSTSTSLSSDPRTADGSDGTILDGTATDVQAALDTASNGQVFRLRGGTYAPTSPFTCPADNVVIANYGEERVVLDGGNLGGTQDGVNGLSLIHVEGRANQHWKGMILQGSGPNRGVIHVLNSAAVKVDQMVLRDCLGENVQIYASDDCIIQDVAAILTALSNGARTGTNAPDCFSITAGAGSYSHRTRVIRCYGAYGQDDGLDNFRGIDTEILDSVMYKGGYHQDGSPTVGDGGNFKTGGDPDSSSIVRGSLGVGARLSNFFHNTLNPSALAYHDYSFLSSYDAGYAGIDAGSQPGSDIRNSISHLSGRETSGPLFYLGGSGTPATCHAGDPSYADLANLDLSLASGSPCLGAASDGDQQGASVAAYELLFKWANLDVMSL